MKYASAGWASYDSHFFRFAERAGYDVDLASQNELQFSPEILLDYDCIVFAGHDEYWTWEMRDAVDAFVDQGGRVARFAANFMWQTRLEDEGRQQVCYKFRARAEDPSTKAATSPALLIQTNRLAEQPADAAPHDPAHRVFAQLAATPWAGRHRITVDQNETTRLQVKFAAINTLPPVGKQKRYSPQVLTYIHALEEDPPPGREPIDSKLVTNLPVEDLSAAAEKLSAGTPCAGRQRCSTRS